MRSRRGTAPPALARRLGRRGGSSVRRARTRPGGACVQRGKLEHVANRGGGSGHLVRGLGVTPATAVAVTRRAAATVAVGARRALAIRPHGGLAHRRRHANTQQFLHQGQVLEVFVRRKQHLTGDQLGKNAPGRPYVRRKAPLETCLMKQSRRSATERAKRLQSYLIQPWHKHRHRETNTNEFF